MENFIVSARKYRPQTFDTVVGQATITGTLKNAIRFNQLAQAFLFCGPRGVGKTTCARILAKTINCEHLSENTEACDKCQSCISFNENASFNIYELDGASNNSVDDIRTLVDQVRIPPQTGRYKVYIIDEVHMLSSSAFNAFLKTLEEPPPYAKFILATTEKHKIIPTILSRCQIFDFRRITVDDMVGHLKFVAGRENILTEDNALHIIAQKADGAMRDALSIFDQLVSFTGANLTYQSVIENLNVLDYEYYFRMSDQVLGSDTPGTLLTLDDILAKGFDGQHFLIGFGEHLRNLLVCKDPSTVRLLETAPSIRDHYAAQAGKFSPKQLLGLLDINNRCDLSYKTSNNKRLHLELALMQMCSLLSAGSVPDKQHAPGMKHTAQQAASHRSAVTQPGPVHEVKAGTAVPQPAAAKDTSAAPPPATGSSDETGNPPVVPGKRTGSEGTNQPPVKHAQPTPVRLRDLKDDIKGTISIRQAVRSSESNVASEDAEEYEQANPFTAAELLEAWNEFIPRLKDDMPHLFSSLVQFSPVLNEDMSIDIVLENKLLEAELFQKKGELLGFLRSKLGNSSITLNTRVEENARETRPYTDKEKFETMAARNPALLRLKENLDLEIEY